MQVVRFKNLGQLDYQPAWDYQTVLHRQLVDNKLNNKHLPAEQLNQQHYFLVVEHPPVYTLGKSGSPDNLLLSRTELQARNIGYYPINRGGDITYHGPGQVVGYPILDLECFFTDVHRYVRNLEEMIIRTLADYGVEAQRIQGYTGVWCPPRAGAQTADGFWEKYRKICAIGVHLSRWVTLHGFAFNINTDLDYFDYIVPCGIDEADKTVTSLQQETGRWVPLPDIHQSLKKHFCALFECELNDHD
ncbi:MAG: lipoyl(octanoyl) transferase LipB [Saprospiraceae bacterium]|nr:lipoyl(octanoyl) transferase LipB [Saprospiraceae bacterium]